MKPFFKALFEYNHYCNQKLFEIYNKSPDNTSEKAVKLFNHILNAQQIWNNRAIPKETTFGVWELHAVQDLENIDKTNYKQTLKIIDNYELNKTIDFALNNGQTFTNSIQNILFQVINHSTYHRGQIATEFRLHGLEPLVTDYIIYKQIHDL